MPGQGRFHDSHGYEGPLDYRLERVARKALAAVSGESIEPAATTTVNEIAALVTSFAAVYA